MVDCSTVPAGEPVPSACRPVRAGRPAFFRLTDIERISLEAEGATVDQAAASVMREGVLAFARSAGSASPPARVDALGGDWLDLMPFDAVGEAATSHLFILADWYVGGDGVVDQVTDRYTGTLLPIRNGAVTMGPWGTVAENVYRGLVTPPTIWLSAELDGGYSSDHFWWTVGSVNIPSGRRVFAHLLDGDELSPTLGVVDSSIITITAFATFSSKVETGWGPAGNFYLAAGRYDDATDTVYGVGIAVDFDATPGPYEDVEHASQPSGLGVKLGRVTPSASIATLSAWEFWTGSGWSSDPADASAMVDERGRIIRGLTGSPLKIGTGHWLWAARLNVMDPCVTTFSARDPWGPWRPIARTPIPGMGGEFQDGIHWVSHHAQLVRAPAAANLPDDTALAMVTNRHIDVGGGVLDWTRNKIQREMPSFVVVPAL